MNFWDPGEDDSLEKLKNRSRDTVPLEAVRDCQIYTQVCRVCVYDAQIQAHFSYYVVHWRISSLLLHRLCMY
jgi:hypothetical protein